MGTSISAWEHPTRFHSAYNCRRVNMWRCDICLRSTKKRANVIRHLKLVHGLDDRDGKNASKETNQNVGKPTYDEDQIDSLNGLQSRMLGVGRPMSEGRPYEEGLHKPRLWVEPKEMSGGPPLRTDSERSSSYTEEMYERRSPWMEDEQELTREETPSCRQPKSISELAAELTEEQLNRLRAQLRAKKSRVLKNVLDLIPNNLKPRAKCICDKLMNNDRIWLNDKQELIIDGDVIRGSNICTKIIEKLTCGSSSREKVKQPTGMDISPTTESRKTRRAKAGEDIYDDSSMEKKKKIKFDSLYL